MEIVSVKIGSPSQATKVNIEAPEQVKVTFKDVVVNNGGGSVKSVNGQTGDVLLDAAAVGALPNTTKIPANTSDLINNSGFITKTVSDLTNYYLKSETYSREKIDNKISAIPKFNIEVVTSLPTTGISDTTVYLVKSGDDSSNLYTEYIYVNGKWEILGKQTVDLSGYALKKDIPVSLADLEQDTNHRTVTDEEKNSWNSAEPNLVNAIFMNGAEVEPNEEGIVDLGALIHSDGIGGDPRSAYLRLKAKETLYTVPYIRPNGTIGSALLPLASATGQGAITAAQFSKLEGIDEGATKVTSENIEKALGYTPADQETVTGLSEEIVDLRNDKVDKTGITLDKHTDGLIYLFVDGVKVGNGVELGTVVEGDVIGVVDENNNILLSGALADGTYTFKYENEDGTYTEVGTLEVGAIVTYTITQNLTNVTSNNSTAEVVEGESFTATLTASSGYNMSTITVTMGGTDITSTAVSGNKITIASVTGDVVITAVATQPTYTNLFVPSEAIINKRVNSSGTVLDLNGRVITNFIDVKDKVPFTANTRIYIKGATFTPDGNTKLMTFETEGTSYTGTYSTQNGSALTVTDEGNGVISLSNLITGYGATVVRMCMVLKVSDSAITTNDIQNIVITIDEPIV